MEVSLHKDIYIYRHLAQKQSPQLTVAVHVLSMRLCYTLLQPSSGHNDVILHGLHDPH